MIWEYRRSHDSRDWVLVLPADWFFAQASNIISAAQGKGLPDFWPVTDWVKGDGTGAFGGYGISQARSGKALGDHVAFIFDNGTLPSNRFKQLGARAVEWVASQAAATGLGIALATDQGTDLTILPAPAFAEMAKDKA